MSEEIARLSVACICHVLNVVIFIFLIMYCDSLLYLFRYIKVRECSPIYQLSTVLGEGDDTLTLAWDGLSHYQLEREG